MCPSKSIDQMSAKELYALAKKRDEKEQREAQEARQAKLEALKEQRKQLIADHKKALAAVDKEIKALGGRSRGSSERASRGGSASKQIITLLEQKSPQNTTQLKEQLQQAGIDNTNLGQQLAYLKRKGRISSPGRGIYAIVR